MALDLKRLTNDFQAAAKNGSISKNEVDKLLAHAKRDGVTEAEARALKRKASQYKDLFAPDALARMQHFFSSELRKVEVLDYDNRPDAFGVLPDPKVLPQDVNKLRQTTVPGGELVRNGVSASDPRQNYIGDCYLIASMSAVARQHPEIIEKAFTKHADGSYTVRLYDEKHGKLVPHDVHIDADLPQNSWYGSMYARSKDQKELWPALLEKAFAARAGSYGAIEAGVPGDAMASLTGKPSTTIETRAAGVTKDKVFTALTDALKAHKPVTAATFGESSNAKYTGTNIYADHTYTVLNVSVEHGKKYVQLRNPWGESEPTGNGRDDGVFKLELGDFMKYFWGVDING